MSIKSPSDCLSVSEVAPQPPLSVNVRLDINPDHLASYGLTREDVVLAVDREAAAKDAGEALPDCTAVIDAVLRYVIAVGRPRAH